MAGRQDTRRPQEREATADYIADLAGELARLSRAQGLDTLAYLLEMARMEGRRASGKRVD